MTESWLEKILSSIWRKTSRRKWDEKEFANYQTSLLRDISTLNNMLRPRLETSEAAGVGLVSRALAEAQCDGTNPDTPNATGVIQALFRCRPESKGFYINRHAGSNSSDLMPATAMSEGDRTAIRWSARSINPDFYNPSELDSDIDENNVQEMIEGLKADLEARFRELIDVVIERQGLDPHADGMPEQRESVAQTLARHCLDHHRIISSENVGVVQSSSQKEGRAVRGDRKSIKAYLPSQSFRDHCYIPTR